MKDFEQLEHNPSKLAALEREFSTTEEEDKDFMELNKRFIERAKNREVAPKTAKEAQEQEIIQEKDEHILMENLKSKWESQYKLLYKKAKR